MKKKIKICGVSKSHDASICNNSGADYVGFNFANKSPRKISPKDAIKNKLSKSCKETERVAVFVDASNDYISDAINSIEATFIQLHGSESIDRCSEVKNYFDLPIIKSFGIESKSDLEFAERYNDIVDYFLFDAKPAKSINSQMGGLNKVFDWRILESWEGKDYFLAGGININNISDAVKNTNAFCLDLASGVEKELGIKDGNMIEELIRKFKLIA